MVEGERFHEECSAILDRGSVRLYSHGLTETFNTLTGGRRNFRLSADLVSSLLKDDFTPFLNVISLSPQEMLSAMKESEARGVRGAAIFDYLHLVAARKSGAREIITLNTTHFEAFYREGDPAIVHP